MSAYIYPGQGAQFPGMGKDLYETNSSAKELFEQANEILEFRITDVMFDGSAEDLKQNKSHSTGYLPPLCYTQYYTELI